MEFALQFLIGNTTTVVITMVALCPQSYLPIAKLFVVKLHLKKCKIIVDSVSGTHQSTNTFPETYLIENEEHHLKYLKYLILIVKFPLMCIYLDNWVNSS